MKVKNPSMSLPIATSLCPKSPIDKPILVVTECGSLVGMRRAMVSMTKPNPIRPITTIMIMFIKFSINHLKFVNYVSWF